LYAILRASIKHSLGQFNVAPVLDFDRDANLDTPYHYKDLEGSFPTIEVDGNFNPFAEAAPTPQKSYTSYKKPEATASWESLYVGLEPDVERNPEPEQFSSMAFETDTISSSLFSENEVEQAVQKRIKYIKIYRFAYKVRNGNCRPTARSSESVVRAISCQYDHAPSG